MVPGVQHLSQRSSLKALACCLLLLLFCVCWVPAAHALVFDEGNGDVAFRAEARTEGEDSFLDLYLVAERPIDSFVLRLLLDTDRGTLAADPVIGKPLQYGYSFTEVHTENDHSLMVAYCSALGFRSDKPILSLPIRYAEGADRTSAALLSLGNDSTLTAFLPAKRQQQAYFLRTVGNGVFRVDPDPTVGQEVVHGAASLAWQLRTGLLDVTGNGVADRTDVTASLMHAMGLIPDLNQLPPLLRMPLLGEKHLDKFRYTGTFQERDVYKSAKISCELTTHREKRLTYYVVDIYIRDIHCLRTALARESFGRAEKILITAQRNNAIYAINGDCYFARKIGLVMQNGTLYRDKVDKNRDVGVLFEDGTMRVYAPSEVDLAWLQANGAYQIWSFGPGLLTPEGEAITNNNGFSDKKLAKENPRTAIGYVEPGHYYFVAVDGRHVGGSNGMEMKDLSILMHSLGCKVAYNLDGGDTTGMVSAKYRYISKSAEKSRSCSDIVYIAETP